MGSTEIEKTWNFEAPEKLYDTVRTCETRLLPMRVVDSQLNRQYYMTPESGIEFSDAIAIATGNSAAAAMDALRRRQRFNLLKSAIDSYCAMVVQVPSIDVTTTGGSWAQRRSAEALGLFIDGVFAAAGMKEITWSCVIDSCLNRVAAVKIDDNGNGGIDITRLLPHQVFWNPAEGRNPRNIFTKLPYSRNSLIEAYKDDPVKVASIRAAVNYKPDPLFDGIDGTYSDVGTTDQIELLEGFRTANADGKDGRHVSGVMTSQGFAVLDNDENDMEIHTIVPLRFSPSYSSYAGSPAGDTLMYYQAELDDFAETIKEAMVKGAVMRVLVDKAAEIDENELNNTQGQIIRHNHGHAPVFSPGVTLPPEYFQREQVIIERAFEFLGVSYNAARGVKADGVSSAKGQREVAALAQNRLVLNMQTIQDWVVLIAKTIVAVADRAYDTKSKGGKDIEVKVPGSKLLNRVKWSEIDYKQEDFEIHCDAINALSRHPAARIEEVLELVQGEVIDGKQGLKIIGNKDLQAARDTAFSNEDLAEKMVDMALAGDYRQPDPYMGEDGLALLIERGRAKYVQELVQKKPSPYLNLLRQMIEAAKTLLANVAPPPSAAAAPMMDTGGVVTDPMAMGGADLAVPGAGLPPTVAAVGAPVPGQGIA